MDEAHLLAAARYIETNPVKAKFASSPGNYRWSSCKAHLRGIDDHLVAVEPLLKYRPDWRNFIESRVPEEKIKAIKKHERTGRPLGSEPFIHELEVVTGRYLRRMKPGPKEHMEMDN